MTGHVNECHLPGNKQNGEYWSYLWKMRRNRPKLIEQ